MGYRCDASAGYGPAMIYLDHNATSPMLPSVLEVVRPWLGIPANPSSAHAAGQRAASAVETAREEVAELLGRPAAGVVFTSGATEANHLALRGYASLGATHAAAAPLEHSCVLAALAATDMRVTSLEVAQTGQVDLSSVPDDTDVLALIAAHNETGIVQPVAPAIAMSHRCGFHLHIDATQCVGRVPVDLSAAGSVALSSHKLGGPPGVGALSLQDGAAFPAQLTGGEQERGRRAGTLPTAWLVGFGEACRLARQQCDQRAARQRPLVERVRKVAEDLGAHRSGAAEAPRLPNTLHVVFPDLRGDALVQALDLKGFAVSAGAACASGSIGPSRALQAMADPHPTGGLRVSLGPSTDGTDIDAFCVALRAAVDAARRAGDSTNFT